MRKKLFFVFILVTVMSGWQNVVCAQELKVKAKLLEKSAEQWLCGDQKIGVSMKYEVVSVLEGQLDEKEIYVVHYCPEISRPKYSSTAGSLRKFAVDDTHIMTLRPLDNTDFLVFDDYEEENRTVYECLTVDLAD